MSSPAAEVPLTNDHKLQPGQAHIQEQTAAAFVQPVQQSLQPQSLQPQSLQPQSLQSQSLQPPPLLSLQQTQPGQTHTQEQTAAAFLQPLQQSLQPQSLQPQSLQPQSLQPPPLLSHPQQCQTMQEALQALQVSERVRAH
jgi:hypothetical protein